MKVLLARAADLEPLSRFEYDLKRAYKEDDLFTLRDFRKHHASNNGLILLALNNDKSIAGYLASSTRISDILVRSWNVTSPNRSEEQPTFDTETLLLLVRKLRALPASLSDYRRRTLMVHVREKNLAEQLFWKAVGFRCTKIVNNHFDCPPDASYLFVHKPGQLPAAVPATVSDQPLVTESALTATSPQTEAPESKDAFELDSSFSTPVLEELLS